MSEMEKVIRDGKVAVCYSPGFGAGWSTWTDDDFRGIALFHHKIVEWIENGKTGDIDAIMSKIIGNEYFYTGGAKDLEIEWLPVGTRFYVHEYDGSESIVTSDYRIMVA